MLTPCPQCHRHVKEAETRCPFCAASTLRSSPLGAVTPMGAAVLTAAALTLAACGGDSKGSVTPPPDPTAPTATATGTTPTQPTAAPTASASAATTTTATSTATPTATTNPGPPTPDRQMAPRYGMAPRQVTPPGGDPTASPTPRGR